MRRALAAALSLCLGLCLGIVHLAAAQGPGGVGVAVPYTDTDGITHGTVMIKTVTDPFTDFSPGADPAAGSKYAELTVVFEAADDQSFDAEPYNIVVHTTDGHLYQPGYVPRPTGAKPVDFQGQVMDPGNRISGAIGYLLPADATIDDIRFQPSSDRSIILADLVPTPGPAAGTAVPYTSDDGDKATVTVTLIDPVADADIAQPAADGSRYVGLHVAFDNTGDSPFSADPNRLYLIDTTGAYYYPGYVPRVQGVKSPNLEGQTMESGDHISGFIGYVVPADATIARVEYFPDSYRLLTVADLQGGTTTPPPATSPAPEASTTPDAVPSPDPSAGTAQ